MERVTLFIAAMAIAIAARSQTITINNNSACDIQYYVAATDPTCTSYASSITYVITAGSSVSFNFGTATWSGTAPGVGWQWAFFKGGNFCGLFNWSFTTCTGLGTANDDVVVMGIPCTGFGTTNCANMDNSCNNVGCTWIRCSWTVTGGNVSVDIG